MNMSALNELIGYSNDKNVPFYRIRHSIVDKNVLAFIRDSCGIIGGRWQSGEEYEYEWNIQTNKLSADYCLVNSEAFYYVLYTIKNLVYSKTQKILLQIKFGKFEFDIFEETRKVVDTELSKKCPKAFEKLTEVYEGSIKSESPLAFQQTAHACRAVLKDFADAVFPVSDKKTSIDLNGKSHPIKDDDYINRIIACVQENTDSKSDREFIKNSLIYLGNFLKSINDLASIGTHHEISKEDANRCLIYTYLVLGDIIKLLEKSESPTGI